MKILAIESSCDDASAAVVENGSKIISIKTFSQANETRKFGGVVPEVVSRGHVNLVFKAVSEVLEESEIYPKEIKKEIEAVAVTFTPGLIGSLLVGLSFAKGFSLALNLPLVAVNHLKAHAAANYIENPDLKPPFLCLLVSGGHTSIIDVLNYTDFKQIGKTRDDAVGEIFDKIARKMGIPYPGGAVLDEISKNGDKNAFYVPEPKLPEFDFSFSGIKTSIIKRIEKQHVLKIPKKFAEDISASLCSSVARYLTKNVINAAKKLKRNKIAIAGGVASNSLLKQTLKNTCDLNGFDFFHPSPRYCTDNAAMIGVQGFYEFKSGKRSSLCI